MIIRLAMWLIFTLVCMCAIAVTCLWVGLAFRLWLDPDFAAEIVEAIASVFGLVP